MVAQLQSSAKIRERGATRGLNRCFCRNPCPDLPENNLPSPTDPLLGGPA